jgi:hypothetical protein
VFRLRLSRRQVWSSATVAVVAGSLFWCSASIADETVQVCGSTYANNVFTASTVPGIAATARCPAPAYNGSGFGLFNTANTTKGQAGKWQANAPAGLELVGATATQILSVGINDGGDYGGGFYWASGSLPTNDQTNQQPSVGMLFTPSSDFGMQLVCGKGKCSAPGQLAVGAVSLYVRETTGPTFAAPTGLWQASGWVRGSWPFFAWGNSPSGLCSISATLNGQLINTATSARDVSTWHQCAAPPISQAVDTSRYGQGAVPLTLGAGDAAGTPASLTKTAYIDNQPPTVALSGATDAPSTAGTQYITASGTAGPSGVAGLSCSLDGAPARWYSSPSAQIAVSGIGEHSVTCLAASNAVDGSGNHGWSAPQTWSLKIGVPTVTGIAFSRIVNRLRCRAVRERLRVPAYWVTVRRHHHRIRVHRRGHTRLVRVVKCHDRTVLRRRTVWITAHRHGKKVRVRRHRTVRIIAPPHAVLKTHRVVDHGRATTVSGWLGTYNGVALHGQTVEVLTAPDNGSNSFTPVARAMTATNGSWSARLPAGPSRLIEAAYVGGPTVEGSLSGTVREIVPARVRLLRVVPRRVPWGGTVRIVGQLVGGYLPRGGALVRLRLGSGHAYTTYGVQEHVAGKGRFSTTYAFGAGQASSYQRFWFQISSLPMGSYPYSPSASGRRSVLVGGHPVIPHHRHRVRRRKRR